MKFLIINDLSAALFPAISVFTFKSIEFFSKNDIKQRITDKDKWNIRNDENKTLQR
jgi:hypothetical protein